MAMMKPSSRNLRIVRDGIALLATAGWFLGVALGAEPSKQSFNDSSRIAQRRAAAFSNPQPVTILGYTQDAMEPFISRDGNFLFFNNSNNPSVDTNLFWASRVDDVTFQFQGEIGGANSNALDAVTSMDVANNFYFISTRSYPSTLSTVYVGVFAGGALNRLGIVPGVSAMRLGTIDFDEEISADGNTLYFTEGRFSGRPIPDSSTVMIAHRSGASFVRDEDSKKIFRSINSHGKLNYAADISADELELFFTRVSDKTPEIFVATRPNTTKPFSKPAKLDAITGFVEAPSISPDGKSLYFHKRNPNGFGIWRVTRP
jgi:hypothetical protein